MASQAVNLKSFVNYVVSLCTYFDGTSLSSDNKTQLFDYLTEGVPNTSVAINVGTALAVLNKLNSQMTSAKTITVTNGSLSSLLSVNSAKSLVDKAFVTADRSRFMTPAKVFNSTSLNSNNCKQWELVLPASSTFTYNELIGTLYGGGGGGSGGIAGDTAKNSQYTVTSGAGATGGISYIKYNNIYVNASGGSGGSYKTKKISGGTASFAENGNNGYSGGIASFREKIQKNGTIIISPAYGGGGGGACTARVENSSTYTASSATSAKGSNGLMGGNGWSNIDEAFSGGGGEGGHGVDYTQTGIGSNDASGPSFGTKYSASNQSNGVGGRGGYSSNTSQSSQSSTIGAGGIGGNSGYSEDTWSYANGGNGGNAGGFVANSSCSAYNTLFIFRGTLNR